MRNAMFYVFIVFLVSVGCKNPAPNCKKFCNFTISYKNGEDKTGNKWNDFGKKGMELCGPAYGAAQSFDFYILLNGQRTKLFTNNGLVPDSKGKTPSGNFTDCITMSDAEKYAKSSVQFEIDQNNNFFWLVKGNSMACPNQCILYQCTGKKGDIRYAIKKNDCSIEFQIRSYAYKYNNTYVCNECAC